MESVLVAVGNTVLGAHRVASRFTVTSNLVQLSTWNTNRFHSRDGYGRHKGSIRRLVITYDSRQVLEYFKIKNHHQGCPWVGKMVEKFGCDSKTQVMKIQVIFLCITLDHLVKLNILLPVIRLWRLQ